MAMTLVRAAVLTLTDLRTKVRKECRDQATEPSGITKAAGELRFSDAEVLDAINDMLIELGNVQAAFNPTAALLYVDITTTDGEVAFPTTIGLDSSAIYKVERLDADDSTVAATLDYIPYGQAKNYNLRESYAIVANSALNTSVLKFKVYPKSDDTFRIWYISPPITVAAAGDAPPLADRWRELLTLGAALRLLDVDGEASEQQLARFDRLMDQFRSWSDRIRDDRLATITRDW